MSNKANNVIADSSFYICFLDDINQPSFLQLVFSNSFQFFTTRILHDEIKKSTNYVKIKNNSIIELSFPYNISEILRPFFGEISSDIVEHKTRILDRKTYYYNKTNDQKYSKKDINVTYNAIMLNEEFKSQSENFLKDLTIVNNIKTKTMLRENERLFKALTQKPSISPKMDQWF